jgi:hypothetical protein
VTWSYGAVWLYAVWWLMELEAFESSMYFRMDEKAADRFKEALENALS